VSKFNVRTWRRAAGPIVTEPVASGVTYEGAPGYARDAKSELFLLAVANMVREDTFYEKAADRDARFERLVAEVAVADYDWTLAMVSWLRTEANMRSASLVGAAEAVRARIDAGEFGGNRQLVDAVLRRADEPGEMLAYFRGQGLRVPSPVKNGIGDAAIRLYTEFNLLKYDTDTRGYRFGDVIDLMRPKPRAGWQSDLFRYALDRRHNRADAIPASLTMVAARAELDAMPADERRAMLANPQAATRLRAAGLTWEALSGWLNGPMDKAAWEAVIPSMGYMALLRNLRNFDQTGVSNEVAATVAEKLADPDQVARSRQLPMRFVSAYRAAPSLRWAHPLEQALGLCLRNVPALSGRTLVLVDTSTSMRAGFSKDGTLLRWDAAVLFGAALANRAAAADLVSFSSTAYYINEPHGANTKLFNTRRGESLLRTLERWDNHGFFLGGGTDTAAALRKHFAGHDRVVIVTDEQATQDGAEVSASMPANVPLYTWNLAGYRHGHAPGAPNRHTFGGLTDAAFRMIPLIESGRNGSWPWDTDS